MKNYKEDNKNKKVFEAINKFCLEEKTIKKNDKSLENMLIELNYIIQSKFVTDNIQMSRWLKIINKILEDKKNIDRNTIKSIFYKKELNNDDNKMIYFIICKFINLMKKKFHIGEVIIKFFEGLPKDQLFENSRKILSHEHILKQEILDAFPLIPKLRIPKLSLSEEDKKIISKIEEYLKKIKCIVDNLKKLQLEIETNYLKKLEIEMGRLEVSIEEISVREGIVQSCKELECFLESSKILDSKLKWSVFLKELEDIKEKASNLNKIKNSYYIK